MLNVRSCYSISKSIIKIDELAQTCVEHDLSYVSICDDAFFGLPHLITVAKKNHLKPVFGYRYMRDDGVYSFFVKNKKGYLSLIRFSNDKLSLKEILSEKGLITVFCGEKDEYLNIIKEYPNVYYGVDEESDIDQIKKPLFFKTVNMLKTDDFQALDLIKKIGRVDQQKTASPESFENLYETNPKECLKTAYTNIEKIVDEIQEYDLSVDYKIPLLNVEQDENEQLYHLCQEKLVERGMNTEQEYLDRVEYEYSVISQMGFSRYLLLAADIVDTANELGAWVGPGRGSAVSSLLVFLLGITQADPIKNGLIFERFLSLDRDDEPDIDIDVEDEMRQELLSALRKKYTKERMVNVVTFGTYGQKLVKRELSKHFNVDQNQLIQEKYQNLISKIIGLPHHVSTHAAGLIFSEKDLRNMIPLRALTDDSFMTQYDMNALKECGLFKMDILGLITLSTLKKTGVSFESLDIQDEKVYQSIKSDNLCGIFQLDSKTGRRLTEVFTPFDFDEIRILISINRPGPSQSGLTEELINRRNGTKKVEYYHPLVKEILSKTWGVPVYQEQIMEMSMKLAGFSPKQANELRKAMAKKDHSIMSKLKSDFIDGSYANDMEKDAAEELFEMMAEFAGYAFNKAHATAYGLITYWTAFTKFHNPLRFYKTMIDTSHGKYIKLYDIINEARKNGIEILAPDINMSDSETKEEEGALRLGFNLVKDLNPSAITKIISERQRDKYNSVEDFILRMDQSVLSDFILKRLSEAHLFDDLADKWSLEDMKRIRDKNAKTLEKIGAKLFGEAINNEANKNKQPTRDNQNQNRATYLQEEIQSYGFVVNMEKTFGIKYDPFYHSEINVGLITNELKANRYEVNNGIDYSVMSPSVRLKQGDTIIFFKHRNESHYRGYLNGKDAEMVMKQNHLSELEKTISKRKESIKRAGIKKIRILTKKYSMEVLL